MIDVAADNGRKAGTTDSLLTVEWAFDTVFGDNLNNAFIRRYDHLDP
ncbi:hypothetical protein PMHK_05720 [Pseudomonas sp. MHK4]